MLFLLSVGCWLNMCHVKKMKCYCERWEGGGGAHAICSTAVILRL